MVAPHRVKHEFAALNLVDSATTSITSKLDAIGLLIFLGLELAWSEQSIAVETSML